MTDAQAAAVLPAARWVTLIQTYFPTYIWTFLCLAACAGPWGKGEMPPLEIQAFLAAGFPGMTCLGALWGRHTFRRMHQTPLSAGEVEAFPSAAYDDLERAYLALVINAIRQTVPSDAEPEVRNALGALGEAIDRLPAVPPVTDQVDDLRAEADALRARAASETDEVVAESLLRQGESLVRRAATVHRSARFAHRALAIRQEMFAQIKTLHAALVAFDTGAGDVGDLRHLAESVRQVAVEADSLAAAREELDAFLGEPPPAPVTNATVPVPVVQQNKG